MLFVRLMGLIEELEGFLYTLPSVLTLVYVLGSPSSAGRR
jgi:hypothetical protein